MRRRLPAATAMLFAAAAAAGQDAAKARAFGGETLRYDMTILGVDAGEVVLALAPDEFEGQPAYRLEMTIETNEDVSKIYRVKDRLRSWVDAVTLASLCFHKRTAEGRRVREETITFDQKRGIARRGDKVILFDAPAFDSLSSVFFVRTLALDAKSPIGLTVVAKNAFTLEVEQQGRQTIKTPAGTFQTIRVQPRNPGENLIAKGRNLVLWLTDDDRHLPVQIRSGLAVGHLVGKLRAIEQAGGPLTPVP